MMSARNTVRTLFTFTSDIGVVFEKTNDILCDTSDREFITMFLISLDISTGEGRFINAGHNAPVVVHADGSAAGIRDILSADLDSFADVGKFSDDRTAVIIKWHKASAGTPRM